MNYLMFHDIRDFNENYFPKRYKLPYFYTISSFKNILQRFKPISFDKQLNSGFIYTFDDGLVDHYRIAEILYSMNIRAVFFVPSAPVREREMILSHKIQFIIASRDENIIVKELIDLIKDNYDVNSKELSYYKNSKWSNNIWSEEMIFITRLLREFRGNDERRNLSDSLFSKFVSTDEKDFANSFYLNIQQVKDISNMNHIIGGHGNKSINFSFSKNHEIKSEIIISNDFISLFNPDKKYYAYANGGFNEYAISMLDNYNFEKAFTTNIENNTKSELTSLFRKRIDPMTLLSEKLST